jgi:hypothetical protein
MVNSTHLDGEKNASNRRTKCDSDSSRAGCSDNFTHFTCQSGAPSAHRADKNRLENPTLASPVCLEEASDNRANAASDVYEWPLFTD